MAHNAHEPLLASNVVISVRRVPAAITLALLVFVGIGTAYAAGQEPLPHSYGVPARSHGDEAVYAVEVVSGEPERYPAEYRIRVDGAVPYHVRDGSVERADRIREERIDIIDGKPWAWWQEVHAGTQDMTKLLWSVEIWSGWRQSGSAITTTVMGSPPRTELYTLHELYGVDHELCGLRNGLQGQRVATGTTVEFRGDCGTRHLVPWASARIDGKPSLAFVDPAEPERLQVWMQEDVPYPLAILRHEDNVTLRIVMIRYDPGHEEPLAASRSPLPAVGSGPAPAGVPAPGGFVAYALAEAVEQAVQHPDGAAVAAFQQRPDVYILAAGYDEESGGDVVKQRWTVTLSDGVSALTFRMARDAAPREAPLPLGLDPWAPDPTGQGHLAFLDAPTGPFPDRADLPQHLPLVVDVAQAFEAWADLPASAYAFEHRCLDADCQEVQARVGAGQLRYHQDAGEQNVYIGGVTQPTHLEAVGHMLWYDAEGIVRGDEIHQDQHNSGPWLGGSSPPGDAPRRPVAAAAFSWEFPPVAVAAGTGLLAALIGALYLAWPTLKQGTFWGLFSRISRPRLLAHPVRADIHDLVEQQPGVGLQELAEATGRPGNVVRHHVEKLLQGGLLVRVEANGRPGLFLAGRVPGVVARAVTLARTPGAGAVLRDVLAHGSATVTGLAAARGLSQGTVSYHMRKLREAGLVERHRMGREVRYVPTAAARSAAGLLEMD